MGPISLPEYTPDVGKINIKKKCDRQTDKQINKQMDTKTMHYSYHYGCVHHNDMYTIKSIVFKLK